MYSLYYVVWKIKKFAKKIATMKKSLSSHSIANDTSLLFGKKKPTLLGVANIFMHCLFDYIYYEYDAPLIGSNGKVGIRNTLVIEFIFVHVSRCVAA